MALVSSITLFLIVFAGITIQSCCEYSPDHSVTSANLSTIWAAQFQLQPLMMHHGPGLGLFCDLRFAAGFYCTPPCKSFVFGVYVDVFADQLSLECFAEGWEKILVWSANLDHQVQTNATLNFTAGGDLVLRDAENSLVWSTNTSGQSVAGMTITELGNLVLFDQNNVSVWQSFDHPTDTLLPGQQLSDGMSLTPNSSITNWTASNQLYFTVLADGLYAFAGSTQPQPYYAFEAPIGNNTYVTLVNGSLAMVNASSPMLNTQILFSLPPAPSFQFIRFESDGHLRLYQSKEYERLELVAQDVFPLEYCDYPTACVEYGICSRDQCSCPTTIDVIYFRPLDYRTPNLGCVLETPISCQSLQDHRLIAFPNISYFYYNSPIEAEASDEESCKHSCLTTCSCKAAMFRHYGQNSAAGSCFLVTQVLSLPVDHSVGLYNYSAYLKIQVTPTPYTAKRRGLLIPLLAVAISLLVLAKFALEIIRRRRQEKDEEDEFSNIPGMPTRFTFENLKVATKEFSNKLGEGGFGSVFQGQLGEETVAIKCLDRSGQGKKEFLAEVQIIGSIHHINLVKLIGFCAEKSHRLLVYEYMSKGSLEKWIYYRYNNAPLDWCTRCRIVADIAKGLSYLHEDCRQRIAHLDIKPQNILLDDSFNAKVSDFGLSKLIDRDESQVMTRMRGTPGYMAPEWLTSQITEKVDVYSFGVVIMEIISGRKNLDYSQPEGSIQLITLLQEKAKNGQLEDMIDESTNDLLLHKEEVVELMKLAMWCLQSDKNRRPAMPLVVKVIEGERDVEANLDYNFFDLCPAISVPVCRSSSSTPPGASILSAPR